MTGFSVALVFLALGVSPDDGPTVLAKLREANLAVQANLVSGQGKGTYVQSLRPPNSPNFLIRHRAQVKAAFDKDKYYVRLDFLERAERDKLTRRIIIRDSAVLFTSEFSPTINPLHCEAQFYGKEHETNDDFPWHPAKIAARIGDLGRVIKDPKVQSAERMPNGARRLVLTGGYGANVGPSNQIRLTVECGPGSGFNPTFVGLFSEDLQRTLSSYRLDWQRQNDVWFVKALTEEHFIKSVVDRKVLRWDTFEVNPTIQPTTFALSALELAKGARIFDERPNPTKMPIVYRYQMEPEADAAHLDNILEEAMNLPVAYPEGPRPGRLKWLRVCIAIAIVAALSLFVWRMRRRAGAES